MTDYLSYSFNDDEEFISTFDELPLWSAPFGLLLLKHIELKPDMTILDIGSGAGFPLTEIASRCGNSCKVYGLDPWKNASNRARQKIRNYGLTNTEIRECSAEKIPFKDNSVDLIVSNLGINNFENPSVVFKECFRVLKPNGKLALTTNTKGHWKEFYETFYSSLKTCGHAELIEVLRKDEDHRGTIETTSALFTENELMIKRYYEESFEMKFVDGSAFLNHHFVKLGWLTTWLKIFPPDKLKKIFSSLEIDLNEYARKNKGLKFTVPMLFIEGEKIGS